MKFTRNRLLTSFATAFMLLAQVGAAKAQDKSFDVAGAFTCVEGAPSFGWVTLSSQTKNTPAITIKLIPGAVTRDVWFPTSRGPMNKEISREEAAIAAAYMVSAKNGCGRMSVEADPEPPGLNGVVTLRIATYPPS